MPVIDRHFTKEEQTDWTTRIEALGPDFDRNAYQARWADLGQQIAAALPMDPDSDDARCFVREWFALLASFRAVASPEMWAAATRLHENCADWDGQADPGFSAEVWQFIQAVGAAMRALGEEPGGLTRFVHATPRRREEE